jgi:hypothetical protein
MTDAPENDEALVAPPLTLVLGDDVVIKMTYGLEMDLRRLLPDPNSAMQLIMSDPGTQDYVVRRCLTDKREIITDPDKLIQAEDVTINSEQVEQLLMWVLGHILYFFVRRTSKLQPLGVRFKLALPTLTTNGSENSPLTTPSAGPST